MTLCPDRHCLTRLRDSLAAQFAATNIPEAEQPRVVSLTCYAIAVLATDATALRYLTEPGEQWTETCFDATAAYFPGEIAALRGHLAPEEQGVGMIVPAWVMALFVRWPVEEEVQR